MNTLIENTKTILKTKDQCIYNLTDGKFSKKRYDIKSHKNDYHFTIKVNLIMKAKITN